MADFDTLEAVAALVHRQWSNWARYMLNNLSDENKTRWLSQIETTYPNLPETQKDSDRAWAALYLFLLNSIEEEKNMQDAIIDQRDKTYSEVKEVVASLGAELPGHDIGYRLALTHMTEALDKLREEHKAQMDNFGSGLADV